MSESQPQCPVQQQQQQQEYPQAYSPTASLAPPPAPSLEDIHDNTRQKEDETMKMSPPPPVFAKKELPKVLDSRRHAALKATGLSTSNKASGSNSPGLCSALPEDLICKVTSFLDVKSLLQIRAINRFFRELASRNEAGWEGLCRQLWKTKIHVQKPPLPLDSSSSSSSSPPPPVTYYMDAYQQSTADAQDRQHITLEELCYDPETHTGTVWDFRFKESAGVDWTAADPWWNNLPCRKMVFWKDGSVRQYVTTASTTQHGAEEEEEENSSNNSGESSSASRVVELTRPNFGNLMPLQDDTHHRQNEDQNVNAQQQPPAAAGRLIQPPLTMSWRFLTRPMDLPERPFGSYLRFTVGGRDVPTYSVRRSPTGNWGFIMESCWGLYTSFEMPPRRPPQQLRRRLRRTETGARWVEVWENGEETLSSAPYPAAAAAAAASSNRMFAPASAVAAGQSHDLNDSELMDDASLLITNEIQWREAFLYNVGARTLPEGNNAAEQFDRAFRDH